MKKPFDLYPSELLPSGFQYPESLKKIAAHGDFQEIIPWWFYNMQNGELAYKLRESDGRNLVPFAKCDDDDNDIACFDADDIGGNPKVLIKNHFDKFDYPGRRYSYADFDEWYEAAQAYARSFRG
jgi:hypothetical protein